MTSRSPPPRASVLAVGTEITTGEITNRNASWISARLDALGIGVAIHVTVADEHEAILRALDHCAELSELVFVTGGLGPTTDDFTRDVIARWCGRTLQYNEDSWKKIESRLTSFGVPVAESNRQQCYFPEGSRVLFNSEGTADAFFLEHREKLLWALPGPPRELSAIWDSAIESELRRVFPGLEPEQLRIWNCLGKSEAELGEIVEATLASSGLRTGYRAHSPYVEIKVWVPHAKKKEAEPFLEKLDLELADWVVLRDQEEAVSLFLAALESCRELEQIRIRILDQGTKGFLTERLLSRLREPAHRELAERVMITTSLQTAADVESPDHVASAPAVSRSTARFILEPPPATSRDPAVWTTSAYFKGMIMSSILKSPYPSARLIERTRGYASEMALLTWTRWIHESAEDEFN